MWLGRIQGKKHSPSEAAANSTQQTEFILRKLILSGDDKMTVQNKVKQKLNSSI